MRKSFKYFLITWILCFAAFNAVVFILPSTLNGQTIAKVVSTISVLKGSNQEITESILLASGLNNVVFHKFGGAFWPGYIAIVLSFVGQLVCSYYAFKETNNTKFFYNISIVKATGIGLIVITVFGLLCMFIPNMPVWLGAAICVLTMLITAISTIKAFAVSEIVSNKDDAIEEKTAFMKDMVAKAKVLYEQDRENENIKKLYEAVRYASPISNEKTSEFDLLIEEKMKNASDNVLELITLINSREEALKK